VVARKAEFKELLMQVKSMLADSQ